MQDHAYYITSESSEDRLDCADNLEDAVRLARDLVREGQVGDPVCIEHKGLTIRELVLMPNGKIEEVEIR